MSILNKQYSIGLQILILVMSVAFGLLLASILLGVLLTGLGYSVSEITYENPKIYLLGGLFSQVIGFSGGFYLFLIVTKQKFKQVIHIKKPTIKKLLSVVGILLLSFPIVLILSYYNSFLKELIPNNRFILAEADTVLYQKALLAESSGAMILAKLFVIALLPAIGEELIFRGVLLSKIRLASNNEHYAVLISALIFSAVHMQPSSLLPMAFLGMILGYLYTRTKNLSYSIFFHFLFNGSTIIISLFEPSI